ncbi:MAG: formate dehydrogenase subunit alpha [Dehalococcoidales bacterium]|nr:MAG: formate dehydrogenase subunit alpha [Dehalococcoidales bacterium]
MAGLATTFGSGAMTNSIEEIGKADCIFIIGSNTSESHPVIALEVMKASRDRGANVIVADPRKIRMVDFADTWLQQKPGTDVALINGLLNIIISENLYDKEFVENRTEGFEELEKTVKEYTPEKVSEITGVPTQKLQEAARAYAGAEKSTILYCMGITQHTSGTNNVIALANMAMATGNIGRESTGVNPLRGQNNVQGACDLGALPNVYTGYQQVASEEVKAKFEEAWGVPLSPKPGLTLVEIMHGAEEGTIKGIYVMGEDPIISDPNSTHVAEALKKLDLLVVQDIFMSTTAQYADVVLPGVSFAEKDGTNTNTERRIQRVRKAIEPIGDSRPDWMIIPDIATRMGYEMKYDSPEDVFEEIRKLTPSYAGISYSRIEKAGLQWPCPSEESEGTKFLHSGQFSRGLGKFQATPYQEPAEVTDIDYPMILSTGRILYHYHGGNMTRHSKGLDEIRPEAEVEINPADAARMDVKQGDLVELESRRGKVITKVKITDRSPEGVAFMTFHFKEAPVNQLTLDKLDPVAKIPGYKVSSIRINPKK